MPPLPAWKVQIAKWRYGEATRAVRGSEAEHLPLSPEWKYFVKLCSDQLVGKEGLDLAMLLNYCPGTFNPAKVAPSWYEQQTWSSEPSGSAHAAGPSAANFLLLAFSRVMHDLEDFLQAVRIEERLRNPTMFAEGPDDRTDEAETVAKDPEYRVPVGRLRKAKTILDGCEFLADQDFCTPKQKTLYRSSVWQLRARHGSQSWTRRPEPPAPNQDGMPEGIVPEEKTDHKMTKRSECSCGILEHQFTRTRRTRSCRLFPRESFSR